MPTIELSLSEPAYQALQQQAKIYNQSAEALSELLVNLFVGLDDPIELTQSSAISARQASRQAKIRSEAQAWRAIPPIVKQQYRGQIVAVHLGQVVDHDPDRLTLYRRVRQTWGDLPILMTPADALAPREFYIHTPRVHREIT